MPTLKRVISLDNQLTTMVILSVAVYRKLLLPLGSQCVHDTLELRKLDYQVSAGIVAHVHKHEAYLLRECCWEEVTSTVVYKLLLSNLESKATVIAGEMLCGSSISIHPKAKAKQARGLMPLDLQAILIWPMSKILPQLSPGSPRLKTTMLKCNSCYKGV